MKRLALAALAVTALAAPASAQTSCAKDYKDFWDRMSTNLPAKDLSADQYARLSRMALRGYDAVHLATALAFGAEDTILATWDHDLSSAAGLSGLAVAPAL